MSFVLYAIFLQLNKLGRDVILNHKEEKTHWQYLPYLSKWTHAVQTCVVQGSTIWQLLMKTLFLDNLNTWITTKSYESKGPWKMSTFVEKLEILCYL